MSIVVGPCGSSDELMFVKCMFDGTFLISSKSCAFGKAICEDTFLWFALMLSLLP